MNLRYNKNKYINDIIKSVKENFINIYNYIYKYNSLFYFSDAINLSLKTNFIKNQLIDYKQPFNLNKYKNILFIGFYGFKNFINFINKINKVHYSFLICKKFYLKFIYILKKKIYIKNIYILNNYIKFLYNININFKKIKNNKYNLSINIGKSFFNYISLQLNLYDFIDFVKKKNIIIYKINIYSSRLKFQLN